jgi:hypothetical protein
MANGTISVFWLNNAGGGFAGYVTVPAGITLEQFIAKQGINDPQNYKIRVDRAPQPASYVLTDGVRVSCTPVKVEGAIN